MEQYFKGTKILYVEDVIPNQILMKGFATKWKASLDIASNGFEAIELVEKNIYDLVIMDIQMPGISGFETAKRMRELGEGYFRSVPIIALTGEVYEEMGEELKKSGINDFLGKPIKPALLAKKIAEFRNTDTLRLNELDEEVDFEETDKLFAGNPNTYYDFLALSIEEFEDSRKAMTKAIRDWDFSTFRFHRHKMNGVLVTLKLTDFAKKLELLKDLLEKKGNVADRERIAKVVDHQLALAIQVLKEKISIIN